MSNNFRLLCLLSYMSSFLESGKGYSEMSGHQTYCLHIISCDEMCDIWKELIKVNLILKLTRTEAVQLCCDHSARTWNFPILKYSAVLLWKTVFWGNLHKASSPVWQARVDDSEGQHLKQINKELKWKKQRQLQRVSQSVSELNVKLVCFVGFVLNLPKMAGEH